MSEKRTVTMREYIQPGFVQSKKQKEVDRLTAILQALRNCHRSMSTIGGGEEAFLAREELASAFQRIAMLRQEKMQQLDLPTDPHVIDVNLEEGSGLALID